MSNGQICPCIHGCREYAFEGGHCRRCLSGWHSGVCSSFSAIVLNPRLSGVDRTHGIAVVCGTCGAQAAQHR